FGLIAKPPKGMFGLVAGHIAQKVQTPSPMLKPPGLPGFQKRLELRIIGQLHDSDFGMLGIQGKRLGNAHQIASITGFAHYRMRGCFRYKALESSASLRTNTSRYWT